MKKSIICSKESRIQTPTAEVLRALRKLEPAMDQTAELVELLLCSDSEGARVSAASELAGIPGEVVDRALFTALADPEEMVRINAESSLYEKHGLNRWVKPLQSRLNALALTCTSGLSAIREPSIAQLRQIIRELAGGRTAEELGLIYTGNPESKEAQSFLESCRHRAGEPGPWQGIAWMWRQCGRWAPRTASGRNRCCSTYLKALPGNLPILVPPGPWPSWAGPNSSRR